MTGKSLANSRSGFFRFITLGIGSTLLSGALLVANADESTESKSDALPQDEVLLADPNGGVDGPVTYSVRIYKEPDRIKLKGEISSEEDYRTLIGLVKANFPAVYLSDRVKINESVPGSDVKIGGLSFALKLLGYVETGHATFDNNGLDLVGAADTAVVLEQVQKLVDKEKPEGVSLKRIKVSAPETSWSIKLDENSTISILGVIQTSKKKEEILKKIRHGFPAHSILDGTKIVEKVPGHWDQSIDKSIELLAFLDYGLVDVTAEAINVRGHAGSEGRLNLLVKATEKLPSTVAVNSEVTAPERKSSLQSVKSVADFAASSAVTPF